MRIGLDARFMTHPQPGGFKTYTTCLVNALSQVDTENEYILYVDREPDARDPLPSRPNFTTRVVPGRWPLVGMPLREQWGLRNRIAADRPDLVHFLCNTSTVGIRTPHVVTLHDRLQLPRQPFPFTAGPRAARRWLMTAYSRQAIRPALMTAARIITVSHYEREALAKEYAVPHGRIAVTHEAASPQYRPLMGAERERALHEMAERTGLRPPFLVGVGYEPRKQIPTLIRALAGLGERHGEVRLGIVAAAAGSHAEFRALAEALGVGGRVFLLGATPVEWMARLYSLADALVFPSSQESFGLPPLEAMACGTPVIALRATSIPEIVGDAAVLIDGNDPVVWAAAIEGVRSTPELRDRLRKRGLERAASFTWRRCAEQTLAVYRDVAERHHSWERQG